MSRIVVDTLDRFLAEARARGVRGAALHVVDEVRPRVHDDGKVVVGPQRWVDLYAYADGVVVTTRLVDADAAAIRRAIEQAGFAVRTRNVNLG